MFRLVGTFSSPPKLLIILIVNILFCDISDGVQKIRYRKNPNPKSNGLFRGGDSSAADIYGFLNRISPPHGLRFESLDDLPALYTTPSTTTTTTTTTTRHSGPEN